MKLETQEITEAPVGGRTEELWSCSWAVRSIKLLGQPQCCVVPCPCPATHCCLLGRTLLPARPHHLLNCVTASLLSPRWAHAQPWCRYPAALQARQHRLSFFWDRSPPASSAPGDEHSGCSSLSSTRNTRGMRSVVRLMTSSHMVMASWCLPACSKADAASRNASGILGTAELPSRGTWGAKVMSVLQNCRVLSQGEAGAYWEPRTAAQQSSSPLPQ